MHRDGIRPTVNGVQVDVPIRAFVAGQALRFNGTEIDTVAVSTGISGPGSSAVNNLAVWNDTSGTTLADGGVPITSVVRRAAGSPTAGRLASWTTGSPPVIQDSAIDAAKVVTNNSATAVVNNLARFTSTGGINVEDSGLTTVATPQAATPIAGRFVVWQTDTASPLIAPGPFNGSSVVGNTSGVGAIGNIPQFTTIGTGVRIGDSGIAIASVAPMSRTVLAGAGTAVTSTTLATTGLTVALPAAGSYQIHIMLITVNSATPRTVAYGMNVSASLTSVGLVWTNYLTTTTSQIGVQAGNLSVGGAGAASGSKVGTAALPATAVGSLVVSGACTLTVLASTNTATVTPQAGSYILAVRL